MVDDEQLPTKTPRVIQDGDRVRIGRVWLEVSLAASVPSAGGAKEQFALELLRRELAAEGESIQAELAVLEGPDKGTCLPLYPEDRDFRVGRSREADLVLSDDLVSRFHVLVSRNKRNWQVHDNGSKRGSELDEKKLTSKPKRWTAAQTLTLGNTTIALRDPMPAAMKEALAAPDLPMRPDELEAAAPAANEEDDNVGDANEDSSSETDDNDLTPSDALPAVLQTTPTPPPSAAIDGPHDPKGAGYLSVDVIVVLVALAVIVLSMVALWWVLG